MTQAKGYVKRNMKKFYAGSVIPLHPLVPGPAFAGLNSSGDPGPQWLTPRSGMLRLLRKVVQYAQ